MILIICAISLSRGINTIYASIEDEINGWEEIERAHSRTIEAFLRCRGTFYLTPKGLIKINNIATLETLPLEEVPQFFVTFWNEGTDRANIFHLTMIQERLN